MKNLGKIIIFLVLILSSLNATVSAKVSPNNVYAGDATTYVLTITGSNINKPVLADICGNTITATGSQTSIKSINGSYSKSYNLSYQFTPKKSCTIDSVSVEIDGKIEHSNSVDVNVLPRTQDANADFVLEFESSAKEVFVGEPFKITLLLKQKRGAQVVESQFIAPEFKGFWIKSESKAQRIEDNEYMTTKVVYELAAQREGNLSIQAAELKIASRDSVNNWARMFPQVRWRTYYSNTVDLSVKALPLGVKIIGDFTIVASVDKTQVNPNEAVNLILKIKGEGNFEDIESFKPYISDVNIFDEKIKLSKNSLSQKIVFVSEQDFTIAPFELKYFDLNTQEIKTLQTQAIEIKVKGNVAKKEVSITRDVEIPKTIDIDKTVTVEKNNYLFILLAFFIGLVIGIVIMLIKSKKVSTKQKKFDIKDEKLLLIKLLPYKEIDSDVEEIVRVLENNIYYNKEKIIVDKRMLKEVLKKYDIS